jgi:hypothetical protein
MSTQEAILGPGGYTWAREARVPCSLRDTAVGAVPASAHAVMYRPDTDLASPEIHIYPWLWTVSE